MVISASSRMRTTSSLMSLDEDWLRCARLRTSPATTAKPNPNPCSPALTDSSLAARDANGVEPAGRRIACFARTFRQFHRCGRQGRGHILQWFNRLFDRLARGVALYIWLNATQQMGADEPPTSANAFCTPRFSSMVTPPEGAQGIGSCARPWTCRTGGRSHPPDPKKDALQAEGAGSPDEKNPRADEPLADKRAMPEGEGLLVAAAHESEQLQQGGKEVEDGHEEACGRHHVIRFSAAHDALRFEGDHSGHQQHHGG